jgi:hypothetical protein
MFQAGVSRWHSHRSYLSSPDVAAGHYLAAGSAEDRFQYPVDQIGRMLGAGTVGREREVAEG